MKTMKQKALRLPALTLAAALAMPALAAAGPQPPEEPSRSYRFTTSKLNFGGEPNAQILIRGPMRPRVVVGEAGGAYLGLQLLDIGEELREFYGAPGDAGLLVAGVAEDSPAAAAGVEIGDVVTSIDEEPAASSRAVIRAMSRMEPEQTVTVGVVRDGAPVTLTATLGDREGSVWFSRGDGPDLEEFHFEMPDLQGLEVLRELPGTINEETREAMREAIEAARERMSDFDYEGLQERLAETEARLRELEKKLAERER